ncbi:SCO6880 family protein [Candidatus Solirubrobacter pratensis]|uniref:SCO6880 family protein n=1 Tax=Candidatus Solirubrobacter pratensis TaxID=1298857 RepID=UPI002AC35C2B|nr:SCO6880 family protein [Candidatus Solirubrobacter pratensis]
MTEHGRSYRFGPLERRGFAGGLQPGQVACLAATCIAAVVVFRLSPSGLGFVTGVGLVVAGAALAFVPIHRRPLIAWLPVIAASVRGRSYRSPAVSAGITSGLAGERPRRPASLPRCLDGCELVAQPVGDQDVGMLRDRRAATLTAVVAVRVRAFGLLPTDEHEARLARWGQLLAGLARTRSPVRRLQILQRALPAEGDGLWRHFFEARDPSIPDDAPASGSYRSLLDDAQQVTQDREILLALQIDERRAWSRAAHDAQVQHLDRDEQAQAILLRELRGFVARFQPMDAEVAGVLTSEQYVTAIRNAYDPYRRRRLSADPADVVPGPLDVGPSAAERRWRSYVAEGGCHRTYWIAQWPRLPVGPLFLTPLLLGAHAVHSVAVVFEPVRPERARRGAEAAITSDEADEELRSRRGFRTSAVQRRKQEAAIRREEELASGHEEVRFAGFVTVSASSEAKLEDASAQVEHAAEQARLDLLPLWGEQDAGFVHGALPVARGLASTRGFGVL